MPSSRPSESGLPQSCLPPQTRPRLLVALCFCVALLPPAEQADASTAVAGAQAGNWSLAGSPYIVVGTVSVPAGLTLSIDAGVQVRFQALQYMVVAGTLITGGLPGQPVEFTSDANPPQAGDWYYLLASSGSTVNLVHTDLRYGGHAGVPMLEQGGRAVSVSWRGGRCSNSAGWGLRIQAETITLNDLTVDNNAGNGITVDGTHPASLANLTVNHNGGVAIDVSGNAGSYPASLSGSGNGLNGIRITGTIGGAETPTTWSWAGNPSLPYVLDQRSDLPAGQTLDLGPGVVVKYARHAFTYIYGTWRTFGTAGAPCWITSLYDDARGGDTNSDGGATLPAPGDYYGVIINTGSVADLKQTHFAYGGSFDYSNLTTDSGTARALIWDGGSSNHSRGSGAWVKADSIDIRNVTFASNGWDGLDVWPGRPAVFDNLAAHNNAGYGLNVRQNPGSFPGTLSGSGNGLNGIGLAGTLGGSEPPATWIWAGNTDFPYIVFNVNVPSGHTLQVGAGGVVKYLAGGWSYIYGALRTLGTPSAPTWFTTVRDDAHGGNTNLSDGPVWPAPGEWYGVVIMEGSTFDLAEAHFDFGGRSGYGGLAAEGRAARVTWNGGGASHCAADGADVVAVRASLLRLTCNGNLRHGLVIDTTEPATLDRCAANNNRGDAMSILGAGHLPATLSGAGNGLNGVRVDGTIGGAAPAATWVWEANPLFPFVIVTPRVPAGVTLEISAGAVVKAAPFGYLNVFGTIRTEEGEAPIWFTSIRDDGHGGDTDSGAAPPAPGDWYGVVAQAGSDIDFHKTWIAYPGYGGYTAVTGTGISRLEWRGGGALYSGAHGLNVQAATLELSALRVAHNAGHGAVLNPGTSARLTACDIVANGGFGLINMNSAVTIDARENWWGDVTGPLDNSLGPPDFNPTGLGSPASDYVQYRPWRLAPATNVPPGNFALLNPLQDDEVPAAPVQFHWGVPSDLDGDAVTYDLTVDDDPGFGSPVIALFGLTGTTHLSSALPAVDQTYSWKVVAHDGRGGAMSATPNPGVFSTRSAVSAAEFPDVPVFRVGLVTPNPAPAASRLTFELQGEEAVRVDLFDIRGRRVRTLLDAAVAPGGHTVFWDGRAASGQPAAAGVYVYRVVSRFGTETRRVVRTR